MTAAPVPGSHADLLEGKEVAHMATIGPAGEPHSQPVWYLWDNGRLLLTHTKARQKYRNLQRDPRVSLSILDPNNPYNRYLEIRGEVEDMTDDPDRAFANRIARHYTGKDMPPRPGEERIVIRIRPTRFLTYG
jgi:PPOX class probable F420-dependent enzyme